MYATDPVKRRGMTTHRDHSAESLWRRYIKPELLATVGNQLEVTESGKPNLPAVLKFRGQQIGRVMSRATQMSRRVTEIEQYARRRAVELKGQYAKELPLALVMTDDEFQRWTYCQEASRRADETADRLIKSLREEVEHMQRGAAPDLVAAMARIDELEPTQEPSGESEG